MINDLVKQVTSLLKTDFQQAGIKVSCHIKPDNLVIQGDWNLLETALINIVKNAVEVLKECQNPEIKITRGKTMDNHVFIEIKDNGPGIPEEIAEQVFIPFYSTKNNGSGIGLNLARQILQMHQGRISLNSKPQEYTSFIVVI